MTWITHPTSNTRPSNPNSFIAHLVKKAKQKLLLTLSPGLAFALESESLFEPVVTVFRADKQFHFAVGADDIIRGAFLRSQQIRGFLIVINVEMKMELDRPRFDENRIVPLQIQWIRQSRQRLVAPGKTINSFYSRTTSISLGWLNVAVIAPHPVRQQLLFPIAFVAGNMIG